MIILGAGIAGCALVRAFKARGAPVAVYEDPDRPPASGNPAALVTPALDAGGGARATLYAQAFARAVELYSGIEGAVIARGAYQLETDLRDQARFDKIALQDLFPAGGVQRLTAAEMQTALGEHAAPGGLFIRDGLVVDPAVIRRAWAPDPTQMRAAAVHREKETMVVTFADGQVAHALAVVVACGHASATLLPLGPDITPVRGQATITRGGAAKPAAFGAYAIPTRDGVLYGATHDRGDTDLGRRPGQDSDNLRKVAGRLPNLARALRDLPTTARVGVRATTRDRMPVAGALGPGLHVLSGLGSRGFTTAPLLAEHVAASVLGHASPLEERLAVTVSPKRFVQP